MELSELHNCEECRDKMVMISLDAAGVSRCGYCNEPVDYTEFMITKARELGKTNPTMAWVEKKILGLPNKKEVRK